MRTLKKTSLPYTTPESPHVGRIARGRKTNKYFIMGEKKRQKNMPYQMAPIHTEMH